MANQLTIEMIFEIYKPLFNSIDDAMHYRLERDPTDFKTFIEKLIESAEDKLKKSRLNEQYIKKISLLVRIASDELIGISSWGKKTLWSSQPLISRYYENKWVGVLFFNSIDELLLDNLVPESIFFLLYLFLLMGYQGNYFNNSYYLSNYKTTLKDKSLSQKIVKKKFRIKFLYASPFALYLIYNFTLILAEKILL